MLKDNPFYILNIPMTADKRRIYSRADELGLALDPAVCEEAAAVLTNPAKRLEAELDWFPEDDESAVSKIRDAVSAGKTIPAADSDLLSSGGRLNAALHDLALYTPPRGKADTSELESAVTEIGSLLEQCDIIAITEGINRSRAAAGITAAEAAAVREAWEDKIRRVIAEVWQAVDGLNDPDCAKVIGNLLETCREEDGSYRYDPIKYDLADRYETRMLPKIDKLTEALIKSADITARNALTSLDFPLYYRSFRKKFAAWCSVVCPVQTAAMARGAEHQLSIETWTKIHGIVATAVRKHSLSEAYNLAEMLRDGFACVPQLKKFLDEDINYAGSAITVVTGKTAETFIRNEKRQNRTLVIQIAAVLLIFMFAEIMIHISPTEEELAEDPNSSVAWEMSQPEKRNSHGEYEKVRLPATGFVFQDTLGDESVRTCKVTVKNNNSAYHYFIRFSDKDYGDKSITGVKYDDEILIDFLNGDEDSDSGGSGDPESDDELSPAEKYRKDRQDDPTGLKKYSENCDDTVLSFVVRAGEETEITLPPGGYLISYDSGLNWYGWKFRFNPQFKSFGGPPQFNWPVMTYDTTEPYIFEDGNSYTVEIRERTADGSIILDERQ